MPQLQNACLLQLTDEDESLLRLVQALEPPLHLMDQLLGGYFAQILAAHPCCLHPSLLELVLHHWVTEFTKAITTMQGAPEIACTNIWHAERSGITDGGPPVIVRRRWSVCEARPALPGLTHPERWHCLDLPRPPSQHPLQPV